MKLIIDIPDYNLTNVQNGSIACGQILKAVKNGKPYEDRPQGEWKLVSDINNDIDVVCPFCNDRRIICYAHGYSIEEVKLQLQEVNNLPNYCENCGADMRGAE